MYKFVILILCATCSMLVSACAVKPSSESTDDVSQYADQRSFCPKVTTDKVAACAKEGGTLKKQGKAQCYACTISYTDAGKTCSGSADCQGKCYNRGQPVPLNVPNQTGQCARDNVVFGCRQTIENGMATDGMLCVD